MKVLLISANTLESPYPVYPIGLDYVAAALSDKHRVRAVDMNTLNIEDLCVLVLEFKPDVIGVSLRNIDNTDTISPQSFIASYRHLIQTIKQHSTAMIILGGSGFSLFPETLITKLSADYGLIGEGENMAALLDAITANKPVWHIPGLVTPQGVPTPPKPVHKPINRCLKTGGEYLSYYLQKGGMLNLQTKRGCPFHCIYCTYPAIEGQKLRLIDPDVAGKTARALQDKGARYLFITDSVFNSEPNHNLEVAKAFTRNGVSIPWGAFMAPMKMPKTYFKQLAEAGLTHVEFGTESLCNRVLKTYGKPFSRSQVLQTHDDALHAGLHVAHYFLLGGPGENAETLEITLTRAGELFRSVAFFFCGIRVYPGTRLYDQALAENLISETQDLLSPFFYQSPGINRDDVVQYVQDKAGNRNNWIIAAGDEQTSRLLNQMHARGYTGPLWEYLIR